MCAGRVCAGRAHGRRAVRGRAGLNVGGAVQPLAQRRTRVPLAPLPGRLGDGAGLAGEVRPYP